MEEDLKEADLVISHCGIILKLIKFSCVLLKKLNSYVLTISLLYFFYPNLSIFIYLFIKLVSLGAGTCLEALRLKKKFITVINDSLMDNHQIDLYEALTKNLFCYGLRSPSDLRNQVTN